MKKRILILFLVALPVYLLDQLTKHLVVQKIAYGDHIVVLNNFFDLIHVRNTGGAFGLLAAWDSSYRDIFFYVLFVAAIGFLVHFLKQIPAEEKVAPYPIALIFGGAVGNLSDRIFRGSVVDYLSFHWYNRYVQWEIFGYPLSFELSWPAFNVADVAITCGVLWLLFQMAKHQRKELKVTKEHKFADWRAPDIE
ncbi:MAG TPA: signal peptidase II [Deltaproteobacteria bacterium]|nr:MAG: signal peptidase II [Deltaproteobacteria bacterium GWA2_45_12]HBF12000.1 signal peptidase II [Deltaproteobacteria bacterium]